jgi:two-component system chemotaxis sensor kinase CheA
MTDREVFSMIFAPGFSTAEKVTDVSGRGVGMDVVKTNIEKIKGVIDIESTEGQGTTLTISIPLTTSITDGMILRVDEQHFILPIDSIKELVNLKASQILEMQPGSEVYNHRGLVLPVLSLKRLLIRDSKLERYQFAQGSAATLAVVETSGQTVALQTDEVLGQTQVVLKSLEASFEGIPGIAGAAILGDGKVALVLDPQGLVDRIEKSHAAPLPNLEKFPS